MAPVTNIYIFLHRVVLDSLRTLLVWTFALSVGWQQFAKLHLLGFLLLVLGMFIYNKMIYNEECCANLCGNAGKCCAKKEDKEQSMNILRSEQSNSGSKQKSETRSEKSKPTVPINIPEK
jgi:hypothetical protein